MIVIAFALASAYVTSDGPTRELQFATVVGGAGAVACPPCVVLTGATVQSAVGSTACAPCSIAKAWNALNAGAYAGDCANALAIAFGEGAES